MITLDGVDALLRGQGLALMFPLAMVEGPIVTVIAGALARAGYVAVAGVFLVAVLADLVGDAAVYGMGRMAHRLPQRLRTRLGLNPARLDRLTQHFRQKGAATLVIGKLTHSAGFAVLAAAGAARMPFGRFLVVNGLATLPKAAAFVAIGYGLGATYTSVDQAIFTVSMVALGAIVLAWLFWRHGRRRQPT